MSKNMEKSSFLRYLRTGTEGAKEKNESVKWKRGMIRRYEGERLKDLLLSVTKDSSAAERERRE